MANNGNNIITPMPNFGLGTWQLANEQAYHAVRYALENGYTHVDCAPIYMNEKHVGKGIKDALRNQNIKREQLWITSKLWNSFHDPDDVAGALKESLHFMQLDYLDLYLIHWPVAMRKNIGHSRPTSGLDFISLKDIPLHETWRAMIDCQQQGLVKNIGVANFSASKIQQLIAHTGVTPYNNQVECHPFLSQTILREYCQNNHIRFTAYASLGSSNRPKQFKVPQEPSLFDNENIIAMAQEYQCTVAQLLLAWALQQQITVIPKSSQSQRISENLLAQKLQISTSDLADLNQLNQNFRYISGVFYEKEGSPYTANSIWA